MTIEERGLIIFDCQISVFGSQKSFSAFVLFFVHLIVFWFNDTSTLVGHFVSFPRERRKEIEENVEMKEKDREKERNESEETEEIKAFAPSTLTYYKVNSKPIFVGSPGDVRYTTPCHTRPPPSFLFFFSGLPLIQCGKCVVLHLLSQV